MATDFADRKCRKIVRQALKYNPDAFIIMIGCYAQLKPEEISEIPGVDLVLGAKEKFNALAYIDEISKSTSKGMVQAGDIKEVNSFNASFSFGDRTRSFLKVQDGCDYKCSFCTIPLARGKSRSAPIHEIVANAKMIAEMGTKEIVLTGVNIGDYGQGLEEDVNFLNLIKQLDEVEGIERFRISSIEPNLCSDEVISFVARSKRFVPHFHMPLQSGNDKQLKGMRRRYKKSLYKDRVAKIKSLMPHCCIGVDVIVGFPGETRDDFMESYRFINELDISYLHVFTYSERKNT
jgi:threonylcarbamoyladenosine tRNA methylthiotransferase MtaB